MNGVGEVDIERLRFPVQAQTAGALPRKPGEKFLKGPVPLNWLARAGKHQGRALHVGIVLWFIAGMKKSRQVGLSSQYLSELGVDRFAGYRGLKALEKEGLVSVVRHPGRQPVVTILAA